MRDGDHNQLPSDEIRSAADGIRYLRSQDLSEGEITAKDAIHISKGYYAKIPRSHIKPGYLLFSIMASIGNSAVVPDDFPPATANRAVGILVPKTENKFLTWYLFYLLSTNLGTELYTRIKKGGLQQRTNLADVDALEFPLPKESTQQKLVAAMNAAHSEWRAKLTEADALLSGLDDFLIASLGLAKLPKDDRKVFAVPRVSATSRFDPHFHLPALEQNLKMLAAHGSVPLGSLTDFSDETWNPEKHEAPTFRYIEISSVNTDTGEASAVETPLAEAPSRARMMVREGDIIVSLTRPHHGAIAQITAELDDCIASTGFSVLRGLSGVTRDYLWSILRSKFCLLQMLQRASGGNYPAITEPELRKVLVPKPKPAMQEKIAAEVHRRRNKARQLRAEAEAGWQKAKLWFEAQLLGGAK